MEHRINLNRVEVFLQIVDAGGISKAADFLKVPKSKLSRHLSLLESELGVQLIYRTTRQFQLTSAGLKFFQRSKQALDEVRLAYSDISPNSGVLKGTIRITAPDDLGTFVLTKIIDEFKLRHPHISFDLLFTNQLLDLVAQRIDIAVRIGRLKDSSMISRKAGALESILVTSPKYLQELEKSPSLEDLSNLKTVGFVSAKKADQWTLVSPKEKKNVKVAPHITLDHYMGLRELVILGHGIGFIPKFLCEPALASGDLVHILKSWNSDRTPIQILIPHQKEVAPLVRAFSDFLAASLTARFS